MYTEHFINGVFVARKLKIHVIQTRKGKPVSLCGTKAKGLSFSTALAIVNCSKCLRKLKVIRLLQ